MILKRNFKLLILLLIPFIVGFGEVNDKSINVSIINLIGTPEKYHKKHVRVIGVTNIQFEGDSIYLSREHLLNGVTKNALWISLNYKSIGKTEKELMENNGKFTLIEGIFQMDDNGHMGLFSGTIENITRFMPWPDPYVKEKLKKEISN